MDYVKVPFFVFFLLLHWSRGGATVERQVLGSSPRSGKKCYWVIP